MELRDEISNIIIDATDRDGVNAAWAADRILSLPRIKEALECKHREDSLAAAKARLGHSISTGTRKD
jgi:hypothetical protein